MIQIKRSSENKMKCYLFITQLFSIETVCTYWKAEISKLLIDICVGCLWKGCGEGSFGEMRDSQGGSRRGAVGVDGPGGPKGGCECAALHWNFSPLLASAAITSLSSDTLTN